jgi:putative flippase GtrA
MSRLKFDVCELFLIPPSAAALIQSTLAARQAQAISTITPCFPSKSAMSSPGLIPQFIQFALVGCAAAVGHYSALIMLSEWAAVSPVPASGTGFVIGAAISYALNYRFVFRSDKDHAPTAAKFLTVAVIGLALNSAIMALLTGVAELHYLPAQVTATILVMVWSYLGNRCWTFATGEADG